MQKYESVRLNKGGVLPQQYDMAHDLCFFLHDLMAQLLVDGIRANIFHLELELDSDNEHISFEESEDILDWLEQTGRVEERTTVLVSAVFPAILSDMCHCIYEALECSRKGKLAVTFMLLRKPLQESLFVLESIFVDRMAFDEKLTANPLKLRPKDAGGIEGHTKRIQAVLDKISDGFLFCAEYISSLRYDKKSDDSFDGVCNKAMHLFTGHDAIRTEKLNINFIFSNQDSMLSQWSYLYSRLPYLMLYVLSLVEHISSEFAASSSSYTNEINRRITAYLVMVYSMMDKQYKSEFIDLAVESKHLWLKHHCIENGYLHPEKFIHFDRMAKTGAFPDECEQDVQLREKVYEQFTSYSIDRPTSVSLFERYEAPEEIKQGVMPHNVVAKIVDGMPPLKAWRKHMGFTQKELGARMKVSRSTYQRYEYSHDLTLEVRKRAAIALGINEAFLTP